uniref:BTB domain-containing protein n=1 Tax=Meloidogyne javanica TaxID=6303 RepID=A0A915N8F5_MELJA
MEPERAEGLFLLDNFSTIHQNMFRFDVVLSKNIVGIDHLKPVSICVKPKENQIVDIWINKLPTNEFTHTEYKIFVIKDDQRVLISSSTFAFENEEELGLVTKPVGELLSADGSFQLECFIEINSYNLSNEIRQKYKQIFNEERYADCKIHVTGESYKTDESFFAHRCILSQYEHFYAALTFHDHEPKDQIKCHIKIFDSTPEAVKSFLLFLYCGYIEEEQLRANASDILLLADLYLIENLKYSAECYLAAGIFGLEDIFRLCGFMDRLNVPTILEACQEFIREHEAEVKKHEIWMEIQMDYHDVALRLATDGLREEIIFRDSFNFDDPEDFFYDFYTRFFAE